LDLFPLLDIAKHLLIPSFQVKFQGLWFSSQDKSRGSLESYKITTTVSLSPQNPQI